MSIIIQRSILDNVGETLTDMKERKESDQFQNFYKITSEDFDHLLSLINDKIRERISDSIPSYERLVVT